MLNQAVQAAFSDAAMKAKLSKGKAEAAKPALSVVDGGAEKEEKAAPKKAPKKAAAPKKSVNPPEAPEATPITLSPLQGRAWDLATVLLKEQVATGQKPNAQVVAEELQIDIDNIKITASDTSKVPNASATATTPTRPRTGTST